MKRSFIAALALLLCICSVGCEKLPSSVTPNETEDTTAYVTEGTQADTEGSTEIDTESTEPPKEPEPPKPVIEFIQDPFRSGPKLFAYVYKYEITGTDLVWYDYLEEPLDKVPENATLDHRLYGASDACFWKYLPSSSSEPYILINSDVTYYLYMCKSRMAIELDLPSGITLDPDNFAVISDFYDGMPRALALKNDAGLSALFSLYENKLVTDFIYHTPHLSSIDDRVLMFKEIHSQASLEYLEAPSIVNDLRSVVDGALLATVQEADAGWYMEPLYSRNEGASYYMSRYAYTGGPSEPGYLYTYLEEKSSFVRIFPSTIDHVTIMENGEAWFIHTDRYVPYTEKLTVSRIQYDGTQLPAPENEYLYHALDVFAGMLVGIGTDGYIHVTDLEGNLLKTICKWEDDMYYRSDASGYHSAYDEYKEGLYLVFGDDEHMFEYGYIPGEEELYYEELDEMDFAYGKPALYLYPEKESEIHVSLLHSDRVTVSYPKYEKDGWTVTAQPDGTLTDGDRSYYCLYWEEDCIYASAFDEGFCVAGKDSAAFLEDALARLGLSEREANECIIYWLPILEQSAYNIISFECTEERDTKSPLLISPAPDTLIRIALHIRPTDTFVSIPAQTLRAPERIGFVAIEWGGVVYTGK